MHAHPVPSAVRDGNVPAAHARIMAHGCLLLATLAASAQAQVPAPSTNRPALTELSLEQLMEVEVTTVSKHREKLSTAPAAIFALNADDLKRAAVHTLPDALRLVPGMQVGRVDSHNWAIGARGFADTFSNKLLVLRDGRSVYTSLFSGVFWDAQDNFLFDIDRIEVVRGPGATLWGANAVNGVINILTKPAAETQGALATVTVGTDPRYSAGARYGGTLDPNTHFRVYAKYTRHDDSPALGGGRAFDDWDMGQAGFRVDRQAPAGTILTLQGDVSRGRENQVYLLPRVPAASVLPAIGAPPPSLDPLAAMTFAAVSPFTTATVSRGTFDGANLLGRLTQPTARGELTVQSYFDYTGRDVAIFGETRRTFDLETQYRFNAGRQEITVGTGYRSTGDHVRNTPSVTLSPARRRMTRWNVFAQDDLTVGPTTHLILGSKFEHNAFTGWEVQPGARLLLTPSESHTLWTSVARAVRTPSRAEDDVRLFQITTIPGVFAVAEGNRDFRAEELTALEAGWRFRLREKFSVDLATFLNHFDHLRTSELTPLSQVAFGQLTGALPPLSGVPPPTLPVTLQMTADNRMSGETYGGELAFAAQLAPGWRVRAAYSHLEIALHREAGSRDPVAELDESRSPRDQGYVWSQHDFNERWHFDAIGRAVGPLSATNVPGYTTLDLRLAWRPSERCEISLAGRNLLDRRHPEFLPGTVFTLPAETPRSAFMEIKYGF